MLRNGTLEELTDGHLYSANDLVKADCRGCKGCSACCHEVSDTILLDPLDLYHLKNVTGLSFDELVNQGKIALGVTDGLILPHLSVDESAGCTFLDTAGLCSIHESRPGFCRMFPIGRYYHDHTFSYVLLEGQCRLQNRSKARIKKLLGIANLPAWEQFCLAWHTFILDIEKQAAAFEEHRKELCLVVLKLFYQTPWEIDTVTDEGFYNQFYSRLEAARSYAAKISK